MIDLQSLHELTNTPTGPDRAWARHDVYAARKALLMQHAARHLWCDKSETHQHGPHLHHGPLDASVLLALVRLSVAMTVQLQVEDCIDCVIISTLRLVFSP